jgi:hypothetical protein
MQWRDFVCHWITLFGCGLLEKKFGSGAPRAETVGEDPL